MEHLALFFRRIEVNKISVVCCKFLFGALSVNIRFLLYMYFHI